MRLFWKVFLTLLAVLLLTALASLWLAQHWQLEQRVLDEKVEVLRHQGETAVDIFTSQQPKEFHRWLKQSSRRHQVMGALFSADGMPVVSRPWPHEWKPLLERLQRGETSIRLLQAPMLIWAGRLTAEDGSSWLWIASTPLPPSLIKQSRQQRLLLFVLTALLAMVIASLLVGRIMTRPIAQLRHITNQLGHGHLDARVPASLAGRGDELGELARDFDSMAEKIAALLSAHKQLLRDISHELRSPLARIQIALELARGQGDAGNEDELQRINKEADRINELIEEVLTLSRFDQGMMPLEKQTLSLEALLQSVCEDLQFEATRQECHIEYFSTASLSIAGDERWILRAIENIARNALRHSPQGSSITVSLSQQQELSIAYACIRIADEGPGIDQDKLVHVFEPFYRAAEGRERSSGGYGLGLAIARQVVLAHGGSIAARNRTNQGLELTLLLPLPA
ncbi:MAG: two-component sensor histidine kinase [Zetaproteobacteria bacterium CG_4_9_14_3_um_filter_49_83]|nr:MAG: hypothetical protein AUJ56_02705 [Zetaproteobacteria bacterium CG1_02_49_23]PIQ30102.1 MAG: two-component sensor histidine kinase [Zetaproteobacteria bacterium CG17_big_fil_post_rev_8_21_14_2_50_50_13]PIV31528.1 MAG: two-component sensor histidine kinase [Zetaproteobacteria bacterium CG02_land_8_20_14_3_00_50_9]PIY55950.1 MAG: two-component sensor histidine kinase [Zetaproteobacteria bacterium CG_4_10_14_0_8_um_filter_49_80]PJA36374.1 MAG: two-component sensor histidine kinase [Zetaprot